MMVVAASNARSKITLLTRLQPRSWSGIDDIAILVAVCPTHHRRLVPYGRWALVGNPNRPDGLERVDADDRTPP